MTKDNRRILTWSLNATQKAYQEDLEKYNHKIYSIGLHEFGVTAEGKIYDFRTNQQYFNTDGTHTGVRFPIVIESQMIQYPSIKWFFQMVLFGWNKVKPVLDNNVRNSEGRLPQDQFIYELNKIFDLYQGSRNTGTPLGVAGLEMDVEASMTGDTVSQGHDVQYVRFLERIKNEVLLPRQKKMRVNAYAMWGNQTPYYYRFHNYTLFAESADKNGNATIDEIQLMTYDFAWAGSSAGASTPIWWFRNVGDWCLKNFDPSHNPKAKLTIDNLFFGAAGYGHRWGMHNQEAVKRGTVITFRNLLGWTNGLYRHYRTESINGETVYIYQDQEYLAQAAFQDEESKNEVMYPHVYDMFKPKYVDVEKQNGGARTATVGSYNRLDYAATNFKVQMPIWTNVRAIASQPSSFSGKAYPVTVAPSVRKHAEENFIDVKDLPDNMRQQWDTNVDKDDVNFSHVIKTVDGIDKVFVGWYTENLRYIEKNIYDPLGNVTGAVCELEKKDNGRINYEVNIPSSGRYRLIAVTSFSWYTQAKLGGFVNGQRFTVGGNNIPEWYPFFMKGSHFYDCGSFNFNAGANSIEVHGELSDASTPIFGFIVCDAFDQNFSGGVLKMKSNIQPFTKKDGTKAAIPKRLALAAKMLRRDARPAILWDDEFRTYDEGTEISSTSYYQKVNPNFKQQGAGTFVEQVGVDGNKQPIYKCFSEPAPIGYSQGYWTQRNDGTGRQCLHFDSSESQNNARSAQLVLSKQWTVNLSIEARIKVVRGQNVGIRFYAQSKGTVKDGYIFRLDFEKGVRELVLEDYETDQTKVIASQPIGNVSRNSEFTLRVVLHNGVGHFYVGGVQVFIAGDNNPVSHDCSVNTSNGSVTLSRRSGACGIYVNNAKVYCYHLGISTTDRWETLEKFEVTVDGQTKKFGQIKRTGYQYDEFGYLIYSGLNEVVTRDEGEETSTSLDYEITVIDWASWQGVKDIEIKLRDAGVWFGELLIGDRNGMSVIWAGDAWSFLDAMNMAVNEYGAKGIGLWTMGQEDPQLFELVPDVVPKKD